MSQAPASLSKETGGTDDYIQKIHLSSKLPTRNLHSRISKAEREAFKTKHAFWVDVDSGYFKDSRNTPDRVTCPKFTNIQWQAAGVRGQCTVGYKPEVGCGHNQWQSTSVSVTCKP